MTEIIIGIDLGTSNSEVGVVEHGKVHIIADENNKILPSFVGVDDNGKIIVGKTAKNQYIVYPERTIKSIKRLMGQETTVKLAEQEYTPQEISAIILKRLKTIAENYLGQPVNKAVITIPAYFSDAQRQATRDAGEIAGLEVVRIINEPTAAALSYDANQSESINTLVYDLGGGTFDVSVVNSEAGVVEVLSSHGDNHLGGDDFDQYIVDFIVAHLQTTYHLDARQYSKAMARINRVAEKAKIQLSEQPYVQINEEFLLEHQGSAVHLSVELSRAAYEEMMTEALNTTMDAVHIALKGAKLSAADIDKILLVGGSTRIPCIRERLVNEIGIQPHGEIDADLCVTMGAAMQAAMIAGQQVDRVLVDVTPYSYGSSAIGTLNGQTYPFLYVPIIHKNSVLPNRKTEAFETHYDGQEMVEITIYQGEDPDALNNVKIGVFKVEGLQNTEAGNIITLTLALDFNGILHVSAIEKASGMEKSITINRALTGFENTSLDTAKQRFTSIIGQMDSGLFDEQPAEVADVSEIPEIETAQRLIAKGESLFAHISGEDKDDISALIEILTDCIRNQNIAGLDDPIEKLTDIIYYLES